MTREIPPTPLVKGVTKRGAWVEYDGINETSKDRHLRLIRAMVDRGFENNLLLSQDAGWYNVGEAKGGKIRGYGSLIREFIPFLEENGFNKKLIEKMTITNPRSAFEIVTV